MADYNSQYTGQQVDEAVGKALDTSDNGFITKSEVSTTYATKSEVPDTSAFVQTTGGTMTGVLTAANGDLATSQVRNIYMGTAALEDGVSPLPQGSIYIQYDE